MIILEQIKGANMLQLLPTIITTTTNEKWKMLKRKIDETQV